MDPTIAQTNLKPHWQLQPLPDVAERAPIAHVDEGSVSSLSLQPRLVLPIPTSSFTQLRNAEQ